MQVSLLIKKNKICLSGYTFRHALIPQADILDIDRRHICRKHRHKNNKKVADIFEKTVRKWPLPGYLPASCHGTHALKVRFPMCVVRMCTYLTLKSFCLRKAGGWWNMKVVQIYSFLVW